MILMPSCIHAVNTLWPCSLGVLERPLRGRLGELCEKGGISIPAPGRPVVFGVKGTYALFLRR